MNVKTNTIITIANAPEIKGLSFRHFIGESDYSTMAEVRQPSKDHHHVDPLSTLESVPTAEKIKENITDDNCDPEKDIIMYSYPSISRLFLKANPTEFSNTIQNPMLFSLK